jgi:hypothetical protein
MAKYMTTKGRTVNIRFMRRKQLVTVNIRFMRRKQLFSHVKATQIYPIKDKSKLDPGEP